MQFLRLNAIALAVGHINAAVLPRQETETSSVTSLPNTSATKKSYLTSITTLPMPTSVEGNTAYPPSTTVVVVTETAQAQTSTFSTTSSSQSPFTWQFNATETNATASAANMTTSASSSFATGLSSSTANITASGFNATGITSSAKAPYANSTTNGLVGGVAATGTSVLATGLSAANATATPTASANSTRAAPVGSTSSIVQLYLNMPSTSAAAAKASATEIPLGSNMTLVDDGDGDDTNTSEAQATLAPSGNNSSLPLFANSTVAGVAQATGVSLTSAPLGTAPATTSGQNAAITGSPARATSTVHFSNTTMTTVTVKSVPTGNATLPASTGAPSSNTTSSSSSPSANAIASNGTMFAVTYDNKNGTIIQLVSASNVTNALGATGTAASTASASANLDRRGAPEQTAAPITPASTGKGSWSKFAYARTEYLPRPSRFFSTEGWSLSRRARA